VPKQPTRSYSPTVAIIGAGIGGIGLGVNLAKRGISSFTIFESAESPGGTWWYNQYPGAECDIPSALYSYSFKPYDWSRTHASQAEILAYLQETIDDYGLRPKLRLGAKVSTVEWDEGRSQYLVTVEGEAARWFDVVATAVGMLNVPKVPAWPGLGSFQGDVMHSARWDKSVDLTGKRVAVVGGGASAAQIVPGLQPVVGELLSFQREPGWVFRKGDRDYTPEERADLARPGRRKRARLKVFRGVDKGLKSASDPAASAAARKRGETYLDEVFGDRPELREVLEPAFQPRCKRNVLSDTFYPALTKPNVQLVSRSVESVTPKGVVDDQGHEHPVDAIVLATGFEAASFLSTLEVVGRDARRLHEVWGEDPQGFLGITMPGFPNFYMLYGPNTHGTVVSFVLERQAEFVARDVRRLARAGGGTIEVTAKANAWFQDKLQRMIAEVPAWKSGCHNFYLSRSGRNVVQWPWSHGRYWLMSRVLRRWSAKRRPLSAAARAARNQSVSTTKDGATQ